MQIIKHINKQSNRIDGNIILRDWQTNELGLSIVIVHRVT